MTTALRAAGKVIGTSAILERVLVRVAHRWPNLRLATSLSYHTGEHVVRSAATTCQRVALLRNGGLLVGSLTERLFRQIYFHGVYEPEITRLIETVAGPGQVWLDVGANIGYYTILLSRIVGQTGKVFAFEPNPAAGAFLERSIEMNKASNVRLMRSAVSEVDDRAAVLYVPQDASVEGGAGRASLVRQTDISDCIRVPTRTISLDTFLRKEGRNPGFMKIDIEGSESAALLGMRQTLMTSPPELIICEVNQRIDSAVSPAVLLDLVRELGYEVFRIRSDSLSAYSAGATLDAYADANLAFVHQRTASKSLINLLKR